MENLSRLESGQLKLVPRYLGFIVNLAGESREPLQHRDTLIHTLAGLEVERSTSFRLNSSQTSSI